MIAKWAVLVLLAGMAQWQTGKDAPGIVQVPATQRQPYQLMLSTPAGLTATCVFGVNGAAGECSDSKGHHVVFPVTCNAPKPKDSWPDECWLVVPKPPVVAEGAEKDKPEQHCKTVPAGDGCNSCQECDGMLTACTLAYCMKPILNLTVTQPVDVPAIQKKRKACVRYSNIVLAIPNTTAACEEWTDQDYWTCAEGSRSLQVSEDGKTHWCHKPQF